MKYKNLRTLLLITLFFFLPNLLKAQGLDLFDEQRVVLWEIQDLNELRLSSGLKAITEQAFEEAFIGSQLFASHKIDIATVKAQAKARPGGYNLKNLCAVIGDKADYILNPSFKLTSTSLRSDDKQLIFAASLIRVASASEVVSDDIRINLSSEENVRGGIIQLIRKLLGEKSSTGDTSSQQPQGNYGYSNGYGQQQPIYQQRSQNYTETVEGINMQMVYVEGGSFIMGATEEQSGDADSDESPSHRVTLDSYYIGAFEVTQAQWRAIMGNNPSYFTGDNNPVEKVSWHDAQAFCQELSNLTGRTYMLPTEAQWEYAARGGNKSRKNKYSGSFAIDVVAWYTSNSGSKTHPVGGKRANELGLYDMSGNVWEWCNDWYGSYSSSPQTNPTGPSSGQYRVVRGGSWGDDVSYCRVSSRGGSTPSGVGNSGGFRVVCLP